MQILNTKFNYCNSLLLIASHSLIPLLILLQFKEMFNIFNYQSLK